MSEDGSGRGDIERTLKLLWKPDGETRRRTLTVATIVDRAIAIADERGLDAVSIRTVAAELGVGTMSLYRYVPSKAELLDLMLDRAQRFEIDELPPGWREAMTTWGLEQWQLHTTHRWLPFVDQSRPVLGPNAVHRLDVAMAALAGTGLTDQEKVSLIVTIESFITALARTENSAAAATERTGIADHEFWHAQEQTLTQAMLSGRFPAMAKLGEDTFTGTSLGTLDFGLTAILDGVQSLLDRRDATHPEKA